MPRLNASETFESEASETPTSEAFETIVSKALVSEIPEFRDQRFRFIWMLYDAISSI